MVMQKQLKEHLLRICDDRELKICLNLGDYLSASDVVRTHVNEVDSFETPMAMAEDLDEILKNADVDAFKCFFEQIKQMYFLYLIEDVLDFYDMLSDDDLDDVAKENVDKHFAVLRELWTYDSYKDLDLEKVFWQLQDCYNTEVVKGSVADLVMNGLANFLETVDDYSAKLLLENAIVFLAYSPRDILLPITEGHMLAIVERLRILLTLRDAYVSLEDGRTRKREERRDEDDTEVK